MFTHSIVLFRKEFTVNDPMETSILHVTIKAKDQVTVFMNGKQIFDFNMVIHNVTISRVTVPADMLSKGTNVIAVCLVRVKTTPISPIDFDLMVKTVPAERLYRELERVDIKTTEDQSETVLEQRETDITVSVPGTLTYLFPGGFRSWINQIVFAKYYSNNYPTQFTIQGITTQVDQNGNTTIVQADDLKYIDDENFLHLHKVYYVDVPVSRIYDGFRFVFHQAYNHSSVVKLNGLSFYTHSNLKCKKSWGLKATRVGDYQIKKCSLNQLGYRVKRCGLNLNRIPEWTPDDSMCVSRYPSKNVSFVDTTFSISGFAFDTYENLFKIISMYAMRETIVEADQITFPVIQNTTSGSEVIMRFTLDERIGDYIEMKFRENLPHLLEEVMSMFSNIHRPFTLTFNQPIYRYPFPWKIVWVISLAVVFYIISLIVTVLCVHLSIRTKVSKGTRVPMKNLIKGEKEKERLLEV